jgi:hypothetical protein
MVYNISESLEPFWAEYVSEASGRDPLAIQNSSVVIYSKLIAGITNVTNRIRYNGFYCWLFDLILKNTTKRNSLVEQIKYIRRGELLIAFIMAENYEKETGVSGRDYATNNLNAKINLKKGADLEYKDKNKLYWQNPSGIFGQYFKTVTRDLNLINHPQKDLNIYTLTSKGQKLAAAFQNNLSKGTAKLFWDSIYKGSIVSSELRELICFAIHLIPNNSEESEIYKSLLIDQDDRKIETTYHRRNSIFLILEFMKQEGKAIKKPTEAFLKYNFRKNLNNKLTPNDTSIGWFLYEINEILHIAFEYFHTCLLFSIEKFPTKLYDSIENITADVIQAFMKDNIDAKTIALSHLTKDIINQNLDVYEYYDQIVKSFKEKKIGECLKNSIMTVNILYSSIKDQLDRINEYATRNQNNFNRPGYANEIITDLLESKQNLKLHNYVKAILFLAINQHTFSSYGKTKIGQRLVHNYMIEDDLIWRLRETKPTRTSPRLQNTFQYLTDVGWIKNVEKEYEIEPSGLNLISTA